MADSNEMRKFMDLTAEPVDGRDEEYWKTIQKLAKAIVKDHPDTQSDVNSIDSCAKKHYPVTLGKLDHVYGDDIIDLIPADIAYYVEQYKG